MPLPNIFEKDAATAMIARIKNLHPTTAAQWGKMNVQQMLAHCNVTYEMVFEPQKHPKPKGLIKFILKTFVKSKVTSEIAYKANSPTASQFIIKDERQFEQEQARLISYINDTQQLGAGHFEGMDSPSFGMLNAVQWNNMFYKHLDHHLRQFGM